MSSDLTQTYKVPAGNVERLTAEIDKLNRRAAKLGVDGVILAVGPMIEETVEVPTRIDDYCVPGEDGQPAKHKEVRRFHSVTLTGQTPKLAGWAFVGTIQHVTLEDGKTDVLLRAAPGQAVPEAYRGASNNCDHCQTARRRNDTFVLRHDDGTFKQVGRNCLVDFLGGKDPHAVAAGLEYLLSAFELAGGATEEGFWGGGGRALWYIEDFLIQTAAVIRVDGWTSRAKAEEKGRNATVVTVCSLMSPPAPGEDRKWREPYRCAEEDRELAAKVLAWVREELPAKPNLNDYEHNLVTACRMQGIDRTAGIVASAVAAYKREVEHAVLVSKRASDWAKLIETSRHVGTVGKREVFRGLTLTGTTEIEGDYGVTVLHRFLDAAGNLYVWFASGQRLWVAEADDVQLGHRIEEGETVDVKATVKAHQEYKGAKQTILSRVDFYSDALEAHYADQRKAAAKAKREAAKAAKGWRSLVEA